MHSTAQTSFASTGQYHPDSLGRARCLRVILATAALLVGIAGPAPLYAATIQAGNVTTTLGPTFFIDDAVNGGPDTDINQPNSAFLLRSFTGLLTPNQGPTRVSLTGFGFALHTSATANDATSVAVGFTYLGADEAVGGSDDVTIGTVTGNLTFTGGGEYVFAFDAPLTADLDVTGTRFRVTITPSNLTSNGSLKMKSLTAGAPNVSVAGVAAPKILPQRVNLAKFQTVTATSVAGNRLASFATDGDAGNDSRWQSNNNQWNSSIIEFPFPVEIGSAQVFSGVNDGLAQQNFGIQSWNGTTWVAIPGGSVSSNATTANVERNLVFTNPVTSSRFRLLSQASPQYMREIALYPPNGPSGYPLGTDVNLNLALQRPAVASSHTTGNFPINAVDGRTHVGSSWQTTTVGVNTLDIEMVASTKIGSVHLYSGSSTAPVLADFTLKYWDGAAWVNIPGGVVTGNTNADRVITFSSPLPTTTRLRLEFTKTGTAPTVIRELQIFPANTGNVGYALGTGINPSGAYANYEQFNDALYQITNVAANRDIAVATGGQPALEPTGFTTAQAQYQVLLNLADGTYRLRNWDTGECLSGAQLSKTAGEALVDEPYLAMPHQDWILEPLGGGRYQIINAWSGLAIDTQGGATAQGTALVQNTASNGTSQQWRFNYDTWAPKKGLGHSTAAAAFNAKWNYNWGPNAPANQPNNVVLNPMQWGNFNWTYNTGSGPIWQRTSAWRKRGDGMILMGFNEPDRTDQSNIAVANAVNLWPQMMALNQPLVGPSPADDGTWLTAFTTDAKNRGFRWEYTAIHAYPGPGGNSNGLIGKIQSYFDDYDLPVWLTEFSFVDWEKNQSWSEEDCYQTLAEFLWRAENLTALRKYALFVFTEDDEYPQPPNSYTNISPAPRSNSYDKSGNLTAFGKLYAAWDSDTTIRSDKTYMVHNRALHKRMANAATTNTTPGGRTIRTDGPIVNWKLISTGTANRYYVVSSIDGRRLSHTSGNGAPTLVAAGTTGVNVQWSLTATQHGWYYIGHPNSNTRLRLASFNTSNNVTSYQMVATTTTDENTQWRFIVPLPDNSAPTVAPVPDQVTNELAPLTFTVNATDSNDPPLPLVYSIIDPPFNSSMNATTGEFRWTPTETQGNGTTYTLTIRVSNGQLATDSTVNITVNEVNVAPVLASIPAQTVNEGELLTFTATATDSDIPANTLTFSLIGAPSGASIVGSTGVFSWTPTEAQGPGVFNFTVRVSDGALTHDRAVSVTVNEVNLAPVLVAIATQTVNAGTLLTFTATATDPDLPANTLTFSMINPPGGASINPTSGVFTWTPSGAQVGSSNFTLQVSDGNLADSRAVSVNVLNPIPSNEVDDDGDGLSDLLEYALGTDPNAANASPFRIVGANPDGTVTLEFQWNWQATGVNWQIHHGSDLTTIATWPVVDPGTVTTVREGSIDRITVKPAMADPNRGFYVLKVILD